MRRAAPAAAFAVAIVAISHPARAQSSDPGMLEIAVGPAVTNGVTLSSGNANETTPSGGPFTLFSTTTTLARAAAAEVRIGVRLTARFEVEGAVSYGRPELRIAASQDAENAAAVTATERVDQALVSGGVLWYPVAFSGEARVAPFLSAEAGYLRTLHEGQTFAQDGRAYFAGGGVKVVLHRGGTIKRIGVRVDGRGVVRSKGLFAATRVSPAVGAALFLRF